jgi:hypothetical protein
MPSATRSAGRLALLQEHGRRRVVTIRPRGLQQHHQHHGEADCQHAECTRVDALGADRPGTAQFAQISMQPSMAIAATPTPIWLPMPPSTTMARMIAISMKREALRADEALAGGEERAGEAAEHGADGEGA